MEDHNNHSNGHLNRQPATEKNGLRKEILKIVRTSLQDLWRTPSRKILLNNPLSHHQPNPDKLRLDLVEVVMDLEEGLKRSPDPSLDQKIVVNPDTSVQDLMKQLLKEFGESRQ